MGLVKLFILPTRGPLADDDMHELDISEFRQCISIIAKKAGNQALRDAIVRCCPASHLATNLYN